MLVSLNSPKPGVEELWASTLYHKLLTSEKCMLMYRYCFSYSKEQSWPMDEEKSRGEMTSVYWPQKVSEMWHSSLIFHHHQIRETLAFSWEGGIMGILEGRSIAGLPGCSLRHHQCHTKALCPAWPMQRHSADNRTAGVWAHPRVLRVPKFSKGLQRGWEGQGELL